jgi:hypothetical protein
VVHALTVRDPTARRRTFVLGALAAWLVSLRFGWRMWETHPGAILAASAATVLFAEGLRRWARADFAALSAPDPAP